MRLSQLCGLPVIDAGVCRQAGVVSEVLVEPESSRIVALSVKHGDGRLADWVPAGAVHRVAHSRVLVRDSRELGLMGAPIPLDRRVRSDALMRLVVLGEDGVRIGRLCDAEIDPSSLEILCYVLSGPIWERLRGPHRIIPSQIVACSEDMMIVRTLPHLVREPRQRWTGRLAA